MCYCALILLINSYHFEGWCLFFWMVDKQLYKHSMSVCPSVRHNSRGNISLGLHSNIKGICQISRAHKPKNLVTQVNFGVYAHSHNTWSEWPEIWHADVSWPPSNWSHLGHGLLIFLILASTSETGQIWGFITFSGEGREGMAWNLACWFILTT